MTAKVNIGDRIRFTKDKVELEGKVEIIYENSVMVTIDSNFIEKAQRVLPNDRTIVSHKKYELIS